MALGYIYCKVERMKFDNLVFVDVEATDLSPFSGVMTEFGAVHYTTRDTFHGILYDAIPNPDNPAQPMLLDYDGAAYDQSVVFDEFNEWLKATVNGRPVFVSDNPAYDFMWMAYYLDKNLGFNPFGHSARRIGDFWAGLNRKWGETQSWKRFRITPHDHNPVNDAMGNVEAFETIVSTALPRGSK
jgi:hypothetical protein